MSYIYVSNVLVMKAQKIVKKTGTVSAFTVSWGEGRKMVMEAQIPYGAYISTVRKAKNYTDLNQLIGTEGFTLKSVKPLVAYLDLSTEKFASLIGVSSRTLSRWDDDSTIGVMA